MNTPLSRLWQDRAACRTHPATWWDTDHGDKHLTDAIAICATCPVRNACLADAMRHEGRASARNRAGIWGGTTPEQRAWRQHRTRGQLKSPALSI